MHASQNSGMRATGALARSIVTTVVALTATACGMGSSATGSPSGASSSHDHMTPHHPMAEAAAFGPDCGMIPASGMGSLHAMSMDPAITAASHNPLLTTLSGDVATAELTTELNSMHAITIFAPANTAFAKLHGSAMSMMHSRTELAKILKYHVVNGRVTPAELASGMTLTTLEGSTLKAAKMGSVYEVNSADVICGNIATANATIYIINKVLIPMH